MALTTANRDTALLHPIMRAAAEAVLADCRAAGLPLRIFEAWRSPERQRYLYAQGRTTNGPIVTYAKAWQSYHQYGLAVDFVGHVNGNWTWDLPQSTWNRLHAFGAAHGLERLGFETPHLQVTGLTSGDLMEADADPGHDGPRSHS
jgi:peptidoglycan LD-endopeptidase CwlK